jgi:hypothetical protein
LKDQEPKEGRGGQEPKEGEKRGRLPILMETIINKEVYERKANLELEILNQVGVLRIDSKYIFGIFFI